MPTIPTLRRLAALLACGAAAAGAWAQAERTLTIGVIELFPNPHFAEARKGIEAAARQLNAKVVIQNANLDATREAQYVQTLITRKVDGLLVSAVSPTGSLAALRQARAAGLPVVCYTTCVNPPDDQQLVRAFVMSDNRALGATTGRQAAEHIRKQLGGQARVLMLTCESYDVCKERRKGLDEALKGLDLRVLAEQEGFMVDKARPIADAMLAAHPDANVFIAQNEDGIVAAAQAIKAKGLAGKVAVFGIDINPQVARLIAAPEGIVHWTTGQDPYALGAKGLQAVVAAVRQQPLGGFYQYAEAPTFSKADPDGARRYAAERR